MKKNSRLHLVLTTELLLRIKKQALDNNISVSELTRRKLKENSRLDNIERMIKLLLEKYKN